MTDFSVRSDNVDVEQIMRQIRARIREKRGVDYTEEEIRELANVKLEKFLDPKGVRSDLLQQYRQAREAALPPNYKFEDTTLFETHRGLLAFIRKLLRPVLKLFFNPNPLIEALHIQSKLNEAHAAIEPLHYEIIHNLVLELTRTSIEVKNLKMRIESMSSRLDFDERRARALEGVVQYRPGAVPPLQPPTAPSAAPPGQHNELDNEGNERRARRRRRRGRRRSASGADESSGRYGATGSGSVAEASARGYGETRPPRDPGSDAAYDEPAPEDASNDYGDELSAAAEGRSSREDSTADFVDERPGEREISSHDQAETRENDAASRTHVERRETGDPTFPSVPETRQTDFGGERSGSATTDVLAPAEQRGYERRSDAAPPAGPSTSES